MRNSHIQRINSELKTCGVTKIGLLTPEHKALYKLIHEDEHIGGVIYGKTKNGIAWLVATDKRILFLDSKPMFSTQDELTYDVVSGVQLNTTSLFSSVILMTRVANYNLRFVNKNCAQIFIKFIEKRRLEVSNMYSDPATYNRLHQNQINKTIFNTDQKEAIKFLKEHDLAVISTIDRTGIVEGAFVYYVVDQNNLIYILTKSDTSKARNIYTHSQVALTVSEAGTMETVQLQGIAEIENDSDTKNKIFSLLFKPRTYRSGIKHPPVTKIKDGAYTVIKITPTNISYRNFAK